MTKPKKLSDQDSDLFRQAVGAVKPVRHDRIEPRLPSPAPIPRSRDADEQQVLTDMLAGEFEAAELETGEELHYQRDGVQRTVLRKLRRGQYRVSSVLDLHGMNVAASRVSLAHFLQDAKRDHLTCVRVIHGKGKRTRHKGPVLKAKVNVWLRQRDDVLAFCSAQPTDGGTGAVYVLLRA